MMRFRPDKDFLLCALSGGGLALAFPRADIASLAWFALAPLFVVMGRRPFRSGFVAGAFFFAPVLYWLNIVMTTYGRLHPLLSVVAYLMLVGYLALFFAATTWAASRLKQTLGVSPVVTLPVLWVALEFVRSFFLTGFPWDCLGYSQQAHLFLIQSVDLFGVYGVSFLLILSNALIAALWSSLRRQGSPPMPWLSATVFMVLFGLNLVYGFWRLDGDVEERSETLKTALIQGNIDQSLKWDPRYQKKTIQIYRQLSQPAGRKSELLVWPEAATPFYYQDGGVLAEQVTKVASSTGSYLLFGSPAYEGENRRYRFLNSAYLLGPDATLLGRSDKVHLVPFGEYVPLGRYLPFIDKLVAGIGDFSPGTVSPLPMNGSKLGVLVCYEAIFPELARDWVRQGSDLLVNITNDAWFGRSSAPYQHLAMTRFRAIENRIWVARAANTGISAFISPSGRITAQTEIFHPASLLGTVGLGTRETLYTRLGDVGPSFCIFLSLFWLIRTRRRIPATLS